MKIFDLVPGWAYAVLIAAALLGWWGSSETADTLRLESSGLRAELAKERSRYDQRVAAEAVTVASAVQRARVEEQAAMRTQQENYRDLQQSKAAVDAELVAARSRVRDEARSAAAARRERDSFVSSSAVAANRVQQASSDGLPGADRVLVDGLLQVATEAAAVAADRNWLVTQYNACRALNPDVR